MTLIEQIKAEIERRIKENEPLPHRYIRLDEDRQLLSFIESLEKGQPSLPSNLDEAAEKKARDIFESLEKHNIGEEKNRVLFGLLELEAIALIFSHFGAEWMAGQFQKIEADGLIGWFVSTSGKEYCFGFKSKESFEVPEGFYIRKK